MRAIIPEVTPDLLAWRKKSGAHHWDEMWEGELHMPPMPSRARQELAHQLAVWLEIHWARPRGNRVFPTVNVARPGGWPTDYRIPDLVLLTPDRFQIDREEYFEGAPSVVVEIHSPGDEAYEKLDFYAKLGVPEVWILDRDTKRPELYVLGGTEYTRAEAEPDGWLSSGATGIRLRVQSGPALAIQMGENAATRALISSEVRGRSV